MCVCGEGGGEGGEKEGRGKGRGGEKEGKEGGGEGGGGGRGKGEGGGEALLQAKPSLANNFLHLQWNPAHLNGNQIDRSSSALNYLQARMDHCRVVGKELQDWWTKTKFFNPRLTMRLMVLSRGVQCLLLRVLPANSQVQGCS